MSTPTPPTNRFTSKSSATLLESPRRTSWLSRSSTSSTLKLMRRIKCLGFCWFRSQGIILARIAGTNNARAANCLTMMINSASMSSSTLPTTTKEKKRSILNYTGARMKKTSRNCSIRSRKRTRVLLGRWMSKGRLLSLVFPSMIAWRCSKGRRYWLRTMLGTVLSARISCWLRRKWRSTRRLRSLPSVSRDSSERIISRRRSERNLENYLV